MPPRKKLPRINSRRSTKRMKSSVTTKTGKSMTGSALRGRTGRNSLRHPVEDSAGSIHGAAEAAEGSQAKSLEGASVTSSKQCLAGAGDRPADPRPDGARAQVKVVSPAQR